MSDISHSKNSFHKRVRKNFLLKILLKDSSPSLELASFVEPFFSWLTCFATKIIVPKNTDIFLLKNSYARVDTLRNVF